MKNALVTGGSSGVGLELSKILVQKGFQLFWVSKSEEELQIGMQALQALQANVQVRFMAIDLCQAGASQKVFAWIESLGEKMDLVVNNAGFGSYGFTHQIDLENEVRMIHLNVLNTYLLTRLFLEKFIQLDSGCIINVSSITAFQPVARMNTYAATKAFIRHFTLGLQEELEIQNSNVRTLTILPAAIKNTGFSKEAHMETVRTFKGLATTTAPEVAQDIWDAYEKGYTYRVSGWKMRCFQLFRFLIPSVLQRKIVQWETEKS